MHRDCEPGEAMLLVQGKLERHSCTVSEDVSCHAVDLYEQEARLEDIAFVAMQQAETAWSLEPTSVHWYTSPLQIARLARRAVQRRVITCTTPSQDWPHPQPGRVNKRAAKYRTTRQVCSVDKLSFVPRCFPHMRSVSILGSTPDRDRCASASLGRRRSITMGCPRHACCWTRHIHGGGCVN